MKGVIIQKNTCCDIMMTDRNLIACQLLYYDKNDRKI